VVKSDDEMGKNKQKHHKPALGEEGRGGQKRGLVKRLPSLNRRGKKDA